MEIDPIALESQLPARDFFPAAMPRYPNLWFLVDDALALRGRYKYAVELVVKTLERRLGMNDDFLTGIRNHAAHHLLTKATEGGDFQMRAGPFHPFTHPDRPDLSHRHQVHARFYVSPFSESGRDSLHLSGRRFLVMAASVHYEVATEELLHPYVDPCPICGITGDYEVPIDPTSQDYCVKIHDPLGVEFMLHGTVRGKTLPEDKPRPCASFADMSGALAGPDWNCMNSSLGSWNRSGLGVLS